MALLRWANRDWCRGRIRDGDFREEVGKDFTLDGAAGNVADIMFTQFDCPFKEAARCLRSEQNLAKRMVGEDMDGVCLKIVAKPTGGVDEGQGEFFYLRMAQFGPL